LTVRDAQLITDEGVLKLKNTEQSVPDSKHLEHFCISPERFGTCRERVSTSPERFSTCRERFSTSPERFSTCRERFSTSPERFSTCRERVKTYLERNTTHFISGRHYPVQKITYYVLFSANFYLAYI
jgi:hypothetical protein